MQPIPVFLLISVLLPSPSLLAQSYKNDLVLGLGLTHYPGLNASSLSFYGELSRPFVPKTIIGIGAVAALPTTYVKSMEERETSAYHFSMNLYYKLVETNQQLFKTGMGFSGGSFKTDWKVISTGQMGTDRPFQPGLVVLMEYNLIFDQIFILGVAGRVYLYSDDISSLFAGIHGGYRF